MNDNIIRQKDLATLLGVSLDTIKRWKREQRLPAAIQIGPRAVGWRMSTIEAFIAARTGKQAETQAA